MKLSSCKSSSVAQSNLANFQREARTPGVKRGSLLAALLTLAFFPSAPAMATGLLNAGPYTAQQHGGVLIDNFNSQAVQQPGLAANLGTIFTLQPGATYNLTGIATYQWNLGRGAPTGGTITIENSQQIPIRRVNVVVQPGAGGVPANWVATFNPPLQLGPGVYIARSSSWGTWAGNSGSAGCLWFSPSFQCGFVRIFGSATLPPQYHPGSNPTSTGGSAGGTALTQSATRPDLRAYGGCAPAPLLPTCQVNVTITPFTKPSIYDIITQTYCESAGLWHRQISFHRHATTHC